MIAPFRGYVYNQNAVADHGGLLVAPPYDVLTHERREAFYDSHPHNFLHVDLGRVLASDPDELAWHDRSAALLREWLASGVLRRREKSGFYLMETEWDHPLTGQRVTRRGFIGLTLLEEPSREASIRLHEQTFSFHKMERLHLMKKTQAQLSPIFAFFPDPDQLFLKTIGYYASRGPDMTIRDPSGQLHKTTFLENSQETARLAEALAGTTIYVADGHHRYMTALNYRNEERARLRALGKEPPAGSALDYVMTYLCPMSDPGLCVLPTHRILRKSALSNEEILQRISPWAEVRVLSFGEGGERNALDNLAKKLLEDKKKGLTVFGLLLRGADFCGFLKIREKAKEALAEAAPEKASLSLLDVSILTNVILKEALGVTEELMDDPDCISYVSEARGAARQVADGERAAFILNPTSLAEILKVTEAGYVMPRKATYFYPKVSNGLVINLLDPLETAARPGATGPGGG
ncbi:MAG: DUF1015 domain-containing protein [Deltaproteobacteria bacterium]|nr:DUF1015 domain-containing protein [Deltaproteobacteria bacterium]